jgi:hypothetical protein
VIVIVIVIVILIVKVIVTALRLFSVLHCRGCSNL